MIAPVQSPGPLVATLEDLSARIGAAWKSKQKEGAE
jgi:hypothetical protein